MAEKLFALEFYPKTITETLLNNKTPPRLFKSRDGFPELRDPVTRGSSVSSTTHSTSLSLTSTSQRETDRSRSTSVGEESPTHGIIKKEGNVRKQLRVLFDHSTIAWPQVSPTSKYPNIQLSVPGHMIRKKPLAAKKKLTVVRPPTPIVIAKQRDAAKMDRQHKEWRLNQALLRESFVNQRHSQEMRLRDQAVCCQTTESPQRQMAAKDTVKVIVIGAGLSGLSAAHRLLSHKFKNVIVLEASNRLGGRIHTVPNDRKPGNVLELGAPRLHHLKKWNSVFNLATRNKLIVGETCEVQPTQAHIFHYLDTSFSAANNTRAMQYANSMEDSHVNVKHINDNSESAAISLSFKDYAREQTRRLLNHVKEKGMEQTELDDLGRRLLCFIHDSMYRLGTKSETIAVQHLNSWTHETSCLARVPRGMSSLFEPLLKHFADDTVHFVSRVKEIDWSSFNVDNVRHGIDPMVKVTCANGRIFRGHHVIITVPLGYLKKHAVHLFHPRLSESKLQAIDNLCFGSVSKVFLHFSEPFWKKSFRFIWTDIIDFDENQDICSVDALTLTAQADDTVVEVSSAGTYLEDVCDTYLKRLVMSVLSSYMQSTEIPEPKKVTRSSWSTNPLFRGSHPFMSTTSSQENIQMLAAPVCFREKPVLLFAGDATYKSYACLTHAARASGLREAMRLETFYDDLRKYMNTN